MNTETIIALLLAWLVFTGYQVWLVRYVYKKGYLKGEADAVEAARRTEKEKRELHGVEPRKESSRWSRH